MPYLLTVSVLMLTVASYTLPFIVCCIIYFTHINILYYSLYSWTNYMCLCFVPFIVTHSCMNAILICWQHSMYKVPNMNDILLKPHIRIRNVLILNYLCSDPFHLLCLIYIYTDVPGGMCQT
jgi:hypothetical protein